MDITVTMDKKLREISEQFSEKFPYLKIEFFSKIHEDHSPSLKENRIDPELTVNQASKLDHNEPISIHGNLKVSTLEAHFQDLLGIGVQVFRKSGHIWLQTTATDDWTLSKQNEEGHADSIHI